jgi:acyl carrier protein
MTVQLDVANATRDAVALVCGTDVSAVTPATTLDSLGADSLARVSIADVIEAELARGGVSVHIDDSTLARVETVGELADFVADSATVGT